MNKTKINTIIISIIVIVITFSFVFPSFGSIGLQDQYNIAKGENIPPDIVYNDTYNNTFSNTVVNKYGTMANSTLTSVWTDTAYSDYTCTLVSNTLGEIMVYNYENDTGYNISSPYKNIKTYYGTITGIAATSDYDCTGNPLIVEETDRGYFFNYYENAWSIFKNSTGSIIKLPGDNWTSLTTNTYASSVRFDTCFVATNINGTVWAWNSDNGEYGLINSNLSPQGIISTVMFCNATYLYGLSESGNIYRLSTSSTSGWEKININPLPAGSISIGISGNPFSSASCIYMYVLNLHNGTSLYISNNSICGNTSITFSPTSGIIDTKNTNEALTIYCGFGTFYPEFYVYQTNGTSLDFISETTDPESFNWEVYETNIFKPVQFSPFLGMKDMDKSISFNISLLYSNSTGINNLNYLSVNFNNINLYSEFFYNGSVNNSALGVPINYSYPVSINITLLPNSAYNSYLEFNVVYYTGGVYIFYTLNITIINHFKYWNLN
jgi:hypothetical protein